MPGVRTHIRIGIALLLPNLRGWLPGFLSHLKKEYHVSRVTAFMGAKLRAAAFGSVRGVKSLGRMLFKKNPIRMFGVSRSAFDYLKDVGDGTGSSTVMAPLLWIARTFPEAPVAMWRDDGGTEVQVSDHPLLRLLRRPNPFYSGPMLWMATLIDWFVDGNSYWLKIRDKGGRVAELWWCPTSTMEPKGTDDVFITHYEYRPGNEAINIPVRDVVHFRFGLDGDDPRKGRAALKSVLREVFTDDEAANFTASLLRNMGVPGLMVSPDSENISTPADALATKAFIQEQFTGDRRGGAIVMTAATKVQQFGFSPEQLLLKELRRIPEERVTAVLGVPAIVAGLGAGLDRSTFSNFSEAREAAYEQTIIPTQKTLGEDIWFQLLPDFELQDDIWLWRVGFDLANVRVLQPDQDKLVARLDVGIRGGWVMRSEGRRTMGWPVTAADDVYMVQLNVAEVPADGSPHRTFTQAAEGSMAGETLGASGGSAATSKSVAETVQKVYLGVGTVVTSDEAREIVNEAGGDLVVPGPGFGKASKPGGAAAFADVESRVLVAQTNGNGLEGDHE